MKKSKIFIVIFIAATFCFLSQILAFASHPGDEWNYGTRVNMFLQKQAYSYFYCPVQNHSATAQITIGDYTYSTRATAPAGAWACADSTWGGLFDKTAVYYSHLE